MLAEQMISRLEYLHSKEHCVCVFNSGTWKVYGLPRLTFLGFDNRIIPCIEATHVGDSTILSFRIELLR